jgi:hypothetical protein
LDIITASTMQSLVDHTGAPCVSIYLPTHRFGRETQQDPIRLRNLLDHAEHELIETGMRPVEVRRFLEPGRALTSRHAFWQQQEEGLAAFVGPDRLETYRLPVSFDPFVAVTDAFHLKPLWPAVAGDIFYILALSRNEVRLWWSDRYQIGDVDLPADIPKSLAEALWFEDPEKQLQHRAASRTDRGRVVAEFHGHGTPDERDVARLERFLRAVDAGVRSLIDPTAPLVLAGVDDIAARYRKISHHPAILDETVAGNPGDASPNGLRSRATTIIEPVLAKAAEADAATFLAAGDRGIASVPDTVTAAAAGRVAVLFLPIGIHTWGRFDPETFGVTVHGTRQPGDRDLIDLAGATTWSSGGTVHATPPEAIPGDGPVAAVLRY